MNSIRVSALRLSTAASRSLITRTAIPSITARFGIAPRLAPRATARLFSRTTVCNNEETKYDSEAPETPTSFETNVDPKDLKEGETPYGLFVRNMIFDANEDHIREVFEKYGEVANVVVARDPRGLSRGYGFVYFHDAETMNRAGASVNGMFWHGRRLMCNPRVKSPNKKEGRGKNEPTRSLYIGNIPYETTDTELNRMFRELDNVVDVRVAVDRTTGWPRGFAHCDFSDIDAASKAMQKLDGFVLAGRELRCDFAAESVNLKHKNNNHDDDE